MKVSHFIQLFIDGFPKLYRLNRNCNCRGVPVYVCEDIPGNELRMLKMPKHIESGFVELGLIKAKLSLCGCCHPPRQTDQYFSIV